MTFALSLGNDSEDGLDVAASGKAAAREREKSRRQLRASTHPAPDKAGEEEDGATATSGMTMSQCKRQGCKEFDRLIMQREEAVVSERERLTELCQKLAEELGGLEEKIGDAEGTNAALTARNKSLQEEIVHSKEQAREIEAQSEFLKAKNQEMNNQVMFLELERQRNKAEAKQAQEDMVKAMWYKGSTASQTPQEGDLPPLQPISFSPVRRRARLKSVEKNALRYSGLVNKHLKDSIEIRTMPSVNSLEFPRPKTASSPSTSKSRLRSQGWASGSSSIRSNTQSVQRPRMSNGSFSTRRPGTAL